MSKLYVMNCKKQDEHFSFRAPETGQLITQTIPKGGQLQIYKDESEPVLRAIVDQHRAYGVIAAADIDRTKPFINLCWQIDKPFTPEQILRGFEHNTEVLTERGVEMRQTAAAAIDQRLGEAAGQMGDNAQGTELSIKDETAGDTNSGMDHTVIVEAQISKREHGKKNAGRAAK